jgi:hypothetical protein
MRQTVLERADEGLVPCAGTPTLVGAGRIPKVGLRDVGVFRLERDAAEHAIASVAVVDPALRTQIEPVDGSSSTPRPLSSSRSDTRGRVRAELSSRTRW